MASVTIEHQVSLDQAMEALRQQFGERYHLTPRHSGTHDAIRVAHGMEMATVRIDRTGDNTTFKVHGGGFIASRLINELGFARRVSSTLKNAFEHEPD
jgi:hypothetical protein